MSPDSPFAALMARVRAGDMAAFEELIRGYAPLVERAARVMLGRPMRPLFDTADLLQTVHRAVLAGLRTRSFAVADAVHLRHLALTLLRRKIARRWRHLKREQDGQTAWPGEFVANQEQVDPAAGPAAEASFRDQVNRYLEGADPTDRRLIELRLTGCTTADAARELGMDPSALRVRLGRLRRRLRAADPT